LVAENEQAAIVQAKDDFAYIIEALHLDGNPPLVATEKEKTK
jgi:hypothetical protein